MVSGRPVALVRVSPEGVPPAPPRTTGAPAEPTLIARAVATPVPRPVTAATGSPVALSRVMLLGVPPAPLNNTGAPAEPVAIPRAVAMPVPKPLMPVARGRPLPLERVTLLGVPRAGVIRVGLFANTSAPVPVSFVITPASCAEVVAANWLSGWLTSASPPPPPETLALIVWLGQDPEIVTLAPCTRPGVAVPVPPDDTGRSPVTPVVSGRPVALVRVALDGVPKAPPRTTGAPADPTLAARAVATPVPRPVILPTAGVIVVEMAAVIRPLALTVKIGAAVAEPNDPTFAFTVARVRTVEPLASPV